MATTGKVKGVVQNLVTLTVDGPVAQNEICYITTGGDRLMAEVLKVVGSDVFVQVFESTRGLNCRIYRPHARGDIGSRYAL